MAARRALGRALLALAGLLLLAAGVSVWRALRLQSKQPEVAAAERIVLDERALAERLARGLRLRTVSHEDEGRFENEAFEALLDLLEELFPRVHAHLAPERVGEGSLLFEWEGSDPSAQPVLLLAHLDVVPAEEPERWTYPPFDGVFDAEYLWGRGAMDDKGSAFALLEALELLLGRGAQPRRRHVFAFGQDEEVGGERGAGALAQRLRERGERFLYALDEGGFVTEGVVALSPAPLALIGVGEKGYLTLELSAEGEPGHSSAPPPHTAVGRVARAVARLEDAPFAPRLTEGARGLLEFLAPELDFVERLALANLWWSEGLLFDQFLAAPGTAATLRTSTAATVIEGGIKSNVLPTRAHALVNFRILTGESTASTLERARAIVDDEDVRLTALPWAREPSPVSAVDSEGWRAVAETVCAIYPEALVAPFLMTGGTDTRHYEDLCEDVYRFLPLRVGPEDIPRFHGIDERIALADLGDAVRFYVALLSRE